jgi:hypothetical protein
MNADKGSSCIICVFRISANSLGQIAVRLGFAPHSVKYDWAHAAFWLFREPRSDVHPFDPD